MPEPNDKTRQVNIVTNHDFCGAEFQVGQSLGGRYKVISKLGRGGMGVVYRVNQVFLNKEFALKTVEKHSMSDVAIRRFEQEARTSFAVNHPNIVAVHDFGVLDDQTPFLVMEIINGETLSNRIKKAGSLTVEQAVPIFLQICFGLAYAHECGVIHRDIKPTNIMLLKGLPVGTEGSVKILDFGIAKFTAHEGGEIQALTRTGEIFGSPLYMSPEQCAGLKIDQRADIYSLGCVFFETLTGTTPFFSDNALATMLKHQSEIAPSLKEASLGGKFSSELERVIAKMLAKDPNDRYQNLGIVAHDLSATLRGETLPSERNYRPNLTIKTNTITISKRKFFSLITTIFLVSTTTGGALAYQVRAYTKEHLSSDLLIRKAEKQQPVSDIVVASTTNIDHADQFKDAVEEFAKSRAAKLKGSWETFKKIDNISSKIVLKDGKKYK